MHHRGGRPELGGEQRAVTLSYQKTRHEEGCGPFFIFHKNEDIVITIQVTGIRLAVRITIALSIISVVEQATTLPPSVGAGTGLILAFFMLPFGLELYFWICNFDVVGQSPRMEETR